MARVSLNPEQHRRLTRLIAAHRYALMPNGRELILDEAGLADFRMRLDFASDARTFASQLVRVLEDHGTLAETGQPALVSLLHWLREEVSGQAEVAAFVDGLLAPYPTGELRLDSASPVAISPSETVRALLMAAFSDGELTTFAFDHFRPVYDDFASGMARSAKVQRLVEYAEQRGETARLLALVRQANPYQYGRVMGEGRG